MMQNKVEALEQCAETLRQIRSTAEPWSSQKHLRFTAALWLGCCLPFALLPQLHWATVPVGSAVGYVVYKLDAVSRELQNPFGFDHSDLPLSALTDRLQHEACDMLLDCVHQRHQFHEQRSEEAPTSASTAGQPAAPGPAGKG